jgi:hypothetical protein
VSAHEHLNPQQFFHGTVRAHLNEILPGSVHGRGVIFPHDTDPSRAYATTNESDAWNYAEKAWHASGSGIPRVYHVEPLGHHEPDPQTDEHGRRRGNWANDYRSTVGWRVVRERPMPEDLGKPEDWR